MKKRNKNRSKYYCSIEQWELENFPNVMKPAEMLIEIDPAKIEDLVSRAFRDYWERSVKH